MVFLHCSFPVALFLLKPLPYQVRIVPRNVLVFSGRLRYRYYGTRSY